MKAIKVFEKFKENSDPIHDMGIGLRHQLQRIENQLVFLMEADNKEEIMNFDVEDNLNTDGTYTIDIQMDGFGMDDIWEMYFKYDKFYNKVTMGVYSADGINLDVAEYTIKANSLDEFLEKIDRNNFWDYHSKKTKRLSRRKAEELGIC